MPINSLHPEYKKRQSQWERCRDFSEGADHVKDKGTAYLPQLSGQKDDEYHAYKTRALFYNATGRTVDGLTGAIMRKDPVLDTPDAMAEYINDITLNGTPFDEFAKTLVADIVTTDRGGILIDRPVSGGQRAYASFYKTESIINWFVFDQKLVRVILQEDIPELDEDDPYEVDFTTQWRELLLENGRYIVRLWRQDEKDKNKFYQYGDDIIPAKIGGRPLDYIPFIIVTTRGDNFHCDKPPILDLVDVNHSHYLSSADLEHGRHFTALPTPWVTNYKPPRPEEGQAAGDSNVIKLGSSTILQLGEGGQAGFMEFTGEGLKTLERALEEKEQKMAILGARLLAKPKATAETAEKARLDASGEANVLSSVSNSASSALTTALMYLADYDGITGKPSCQLNKDFLIFEIDPSMLTVLTQQVQAGLISHETFYEILQRGELANSQRTFEDELDKIESQPILSNVAGGLPNDDDA